MNDQEAWKAQRRADDKGTNALILEILFGIFGILGVGHIYANRVGFGLALMVGYWVYGFVAFFLSSITAGLGVCLFLPLSLAIVIFSGIKARDYLREYGDTVDTGKMLLFVGGGCLGLIVVLFLIASVIGFAFML